jgi:hypothetical protein
MMRPSKEPFVRILSVVATPVAILLPSKSWHVDAGKIALLGLGATTYFLFTSIYYFPGGADQFMQYAHALVEGKTLAPAVSQRDIGYPFLLTLSGYTLTGSFIGITLIEAAFAILMPVLVYWSIVRASPAVAFYTGIVSIVSLAPIYFLKWIHHDQAYIFFIILVIALLANFLQSRQYGLLYCFTLAALAASFTRPAGNLLFPVLLIIAYVTVRGRILHYLACLLIFVSAAALYQWHRYEIFDMRNQASVPSYSGQQIFYNLYINSGEFGIRISPKIGPNLDQVTEVLREKLQPNPRDSVYLRHYLAGVPAAFLEEHVLPYTSDQLIERIYDAPNWEYYLWLASADGNDQHYLAASWEIARAYPLYVARYGLRNLLHLLFDPGYAHTRQNARGFHKIGLQFLPVTGGVVGAEEIEPRAQREVKYFPLPDHSVRIQTAMHNIKTFWDAHFVDFVRYTSILMVVAWVGALFRLLCLLLARTRPCQIFASPAIEGIVASVIAASMFLLYNDLTAALFAEPDYRYFHFTELLRIIIAGFAVAFVLLVLFAPETKTGAFVHASRPYQLAAATFSRLRSYDFCEQYFGPRPMQWAAILTLLTTASFACWVSFMVPRTW